MSEYAKTDVRTKAEDQVKPAVPTVTLTIDGRQTTVPKGTTVLQASLDMGIKIPYFCWHPKLKPVGACRMCYVEIEKMPKLQVSCATECTAGMVVRTASQQVLEGRRAIIEFTLINHPLDCPTCDKGGECDLQDLTFAHGYDDTRFDFEKHRFIDDEVHTTFDDVRIGPEIVLNRNRCILCYKCVRANKEAFGEYDLGAYERGNHTEIHAAPNQQVDNPFSGNLVEICPVGALTNTDWRYKIRVWLTEKIAAIDPFGSSGLNINFSREQHKNKIFRVTSRRNDDIDDGWMPDVTRYGYQHVHSPERVQKPLIKKNGQQVQATWEEALALIAQRLKAVNDQHGSVCIGGLAGPQLDNSSLYAFNKFMRTVIGTNAVDYRYEYKLLPAGGESVWQVASSRPFHISEIDKSDVIVTFGTDLLREHPNEYLRIRKACAFGGAKYFSVNPYAAKTSDVARLELTYTAGTDELMLNAICLAAIEEKLVPEADKLVSKLSPSTLKETAKLCGVDESEVKALARAIAEGKNITFFAGELVNTSTAREAIAAAIANVNRLFGIEDKGQLAILPRHANTRGAERVGAVAAPMPQVKKALQAIWGEYPNTDACATDEMLARAIKGELDVMLVMGANPVMLYPDREFAREALDKLDFLVVADLFETDTTALADVILPLASWAEYAGDYVNLENRVQRSQPGIKLIEDARPAYTILSMIAEEMGQTLFASERDRESEVARLLEVGAQMPWPKDYIAVAPAATEPGEGDSAYVLMVGDDPHHAGYLTEKSGSLSNFVSEAYVELSTSAAAKLGVKDKSMVRVETKTAKVILPVRVSEYLEGDVVLVPRNFAAAKVNNLQSRKKRVDRVKITRMDA